MIEFICMGQFAALPETPEGYIAKVNLFHNSRNPMYDNSDYIDNDIPITFEIIVPSRYISFSFPDCETADHCFLPIFDKMEIENIIRKHDKYIADTESHFTSVEVWFNFEGKPVLEFPLFYQNT